MPPMFTRNIAETDSPISPKLRAHIAEIEIRPRQGFIYTLPFSASLMQRRRIYLY